MFFCAALVGRTLIGRVPVDPEDKITRTVDAVQMHSDPAALPKWMRRPGKNFGETRAVLCY